MSLDIACPIHGRVDVAPVADIISHPAMQRLNRVQQMGGVYVVFPGAKHTRFAHCLGAYSIMRRRMDWLLGQGLVSGEEAAAGAIAALVHDAGHRPFSHMVELLIGDHDERLLYLIRHDLAAPLEGAGVDLDLLETITRREHPLSDLVFHTPLGADKLDYLARDAYHVLGTRHSLQDFYTLHVGWKRKTGLYLKNGGLAAYMNLLNTYWYQYAEMYDRPSGRAVERYLQELIWQAVKVDPGLQHSLEEGGEDELIGAIAAWCFAHPGHEVAERYARVAARKHPRKCLVISQRPELAAVRSGSGHASLGCDAAFIARSETWTPDDLSRLEREIAGLLGVPAWDVSLSPAPAARRWSVPALKVEMGDGKLRPILDIMPELSQSAASYAAMGLSVVVSLADETREKVAKDAGAQKAIMRALL